MSKPLNSVVLKKQPAEGLNKKPVTATSATNVISEPSIFREDDGTFVGIYLPDVLIGGGQEYASRLYGLKYAQSDRLSGISSSSLIFGSAPRDPIKNLAARKCAFNRENPEAFEDLIFLGSLAESHFSREASAEWAGHVRSMESVAPYWHMPRSRFTSGIINNSNQLIYHTDNGNMPGCFSAMYTFRKGVEGGYLHLPEYDAIIENAHNSLLLFDGARVLHGVTPFQRAASMAKRITIVFYVLEKMSKCCANEAEEVKYMNKARTEKMFQ